MKTPYRFRTNPPRHYSGPLTVACPQCGVPPGVACRAKPSYDSNGVPYSRRTLKNPHRQRKVYPSAQRVGSEGASADQEGSIMANQNDAQRQQQEEQRRQEQQRRQEEQRRQQEQQGQQPTPEQ